MGGFGTCCGLGGFGSLGIIGVILNLVIVISVIIGAILLVVWMVRRVGREGSTSTALQASSNQSVSPTDILQMRYAQGEITRKEYQQMLTDLK
jgi:uncharacterized membrane protein